MLMREPDINCNKQISEVARKLLRIIKQIWYSRHVHEGAVDKRKETFNIQHSSYPDRWSQNDMPKTSISLELLINEQFILNELGGISLLILIVIVLTVDFYLFITWQIASRVKFL